MPAARAGRTLPVVERLTVRYRGAIVGTIAQAPDGVSAFEYDAAWLRSGFSISPLSLPLRPGVFVADPDPFGGVFGVFNDSLPDGWGALLVDRELRALGVEPASVTPMTRLAIAGSGARGGLTYEPESVLPGKDGADLDLDGLAALCEDILQDRPTDDLDVAFAVGGSSGGARPKAYMVDGEGSWLVKFPSSLDPADIGRQEYEYSICAGDCGVEMPRTRLLPSSRCTGYFCTERFDRDRQGRGVHMLTASGMLEVSHRYPVLDYRHLFQATVRLTRDASQLERLYRLMCFNVFAHNQDDHSNNFAWLCEGGAWRLSPAYDLTFSTSYGNEHATSVSGSGRPGMEDVVGLGEEFGIGRKKARAIAADIERKCRELLLSLGLPRQ